VTLLFSRKETEKSEVNLDNSRTFQYIKIENEGRRYFCLQQNLAVLAWILYFKKNTLRPIIRRDSKRFSLRFVVSWLRNNYRLFRKNSIFLIIFTCYKYQLRRLDSVVSLPFYGQICVPVHKGYKIFDLYRGKVIKLFDPDVDASRIVTQIEGLKNISHLDCAPSE